MILYRMILYRKPVSVEFVYSNDPLKSIKLVIVILHLLQIASLQILYR